MAEANDLEGVDDMAGDNSENDQGHLHCVACKGVFEHVEYYRCSCSSENWKESGFDEFYCDVCIGPHIRQKHEVLDYKGCKPAICSTHEVISTLFCYDCDKLFCFKCLGPHCKHDYRTLSEKANEVRKLVFEYLNQFDELAKPLARRKSIVKKCAEARIEFYPNLVGDNFCKDLCERFEKVVHSKAPNLGKNFLEKLGTVNGNETIFGVIERADARVVNLRQMLPMSDSAFLSNFAENSAEVGLSLKEQKEELEYCQIVNWCRDLDVIMEQWLKNLLQQWKMPVAEKFYELPLAFDETRPYTFSFDCDIIYNAVFTGTRVSFSTLTCKVVYCKKPAFPRYNIDVANPRAVFKHTNTVAIVCEANNVLLYNLVKKQKINIVQVPDSMEVLAMKVVKENPMFFVWHSEMRLILTLILTIHNFSFMSMKIPCKSKPQLMTSCGTVLAFVENDNELTVTDYSNGLVVKILPAHHGLSRIDQMYLDFYMGSNLPPYTVVLFNYESKTAVIAMCSLQDKSQLNWQVEFVRKLQVGNDITLLAVSKEDYRFLIVDSAGKFFVSGKDSWFG